ncbi:HIT family protein [Paraburkholderia caballeronis]|uniref:Histidine triad (HIT) family protein n=1 Tax=Paraburkholderia caballeronis TaxID=416943 RepID=A0A1H7TZG8_9BURK|nr:HIT family protein [Paraburkholderia caballeronis]PXW23430.1 histidine triad (HIT) family protein [Paraburkholderia caballeronis]PXW98423.1 histidine triad (HIT) family protein [Paraburkholderia caballeronis]RAJ95154.1 histidine triad (HIT) family protein [Paraburkholderia caballeronis]SEC53814.1 histidine triad (HIT) family protein [Paraburkholderia caballeronis]SEL90262.1 histidine triad (HIT) family protein [Paraburkholderia caballeronis]
MAYDVNNIFARILRGEAPCVRICESDTTLAIMDLMPQADGHVLVLPKEAAIEIYELSPEAGAACIRTVQQVAAAIRRALAPDGLLVAQFNGAAAGQTVPHVHFHLIPRWAGHELRPHAREMAATEKLEELAGRIRGAL